MKNFYKKSVILIAIFFAYQLVSGQEIAKQLIVASGGSFSNPDDYVSMSAFDPLNQTSNEFNTIFTQSVQDIIIEDNFAYVAAQDSIIKYDIETFTRLSAIAESNLNRLFIFDDKLVVSRQTGTAGPPTDGYYVKIFNASDLSLIANIAGISSDAASSILVNDSLYVAISGTWEASEGKLAIIDTDNFELGREINFGTEAVGIYNLYSIGDTIYSVNKSPYLATSGSITKYNSINSSFSTTTHQFVFGKGVGNDGNILYLGLNHGIGSYNLFNNEIIDEEIVPDPGSASYISICDGSFDHVNDLIYVTISDYYSFGEGKIYDLSGTLTGTFEAGISPEAIALQFVDESGIENNTENIMFSFYPNPVSDVLNIRFTENNIPDEIFITDVFGRQIYNSKTLKSGNNNIDFSIFPSGLYFLNLIFGNKKIIEKIIK